MSDFSDYKKYFKEYQKRFGLNGWNIFFKHEPLDNAFADIDIGLSEMSAVTRLNSKLPTEDKPFNNIRTNAKHEALHLLIGRLSQNARYRYATKEEIAETIEELVNKLVGLIKD